MTAVLNTQTAVVRVQPRSLVVLAGIPGAGKTTLLTRLDADEPVTVLDSDQVRMWLEPRVRLLKVDTDAEPALGVRYNIRSIPTLALFRGGREVARQSGATNSAGIVQWVNAHRT